MSSPKFDKKKKTYNKTHEQIINVIWESNFLINLEYVRNKYIPRKILNQWTNNVIYVNIFLIDFSILIVVFANLFI